MTGGSDNAGSGGTNRPHCLNRDACAAKGAGHCRRCALTEVNSRPGTREKKVAGFREWLSDPSNYKSWRKKTADAQRNQSAEARAGRSMSGKLYGAKNIDSTRNAESRAKAGRTIRAVKLSHIPEEYWDQYRFLIRTKAYTKAEATKFILEQAERDRTIRLNRQFRAMEERPGYRVPGYNRELAA